MQVKIGPLFCCCLINKIIANYKLLHIRHHIIVLSQSRYVSLITDPQNPHINFKLHLNKLAYATAN